MGSVCCSTQRSYLEDEELLDNQEPGQNVKWTSGAKLATMGKTQRFEHSMPFHTLRVDIFEGNVKRFVHGARFVTLRQLRYAFKHRPFFQEHLPFIRVTGEEGEGVDDEDPGGSIMTRLITDDMLLYKMRQREEENESELTFGQVKIDIYKLITLGVILCWGNEKLKSKVFYNAIQLHIQEFIVPNERMQQVVKDVIRFSTLLMVKHQCQEAKDSTFEQAEIPLKQLDEDLIEEVMEDFLEQMFGTASKLTRSNFLSKLTSGKCKWILDSEAVRGKVKQLLKKRQGDVHVPDLMEKPATKPSQQPIFESEESDWSGP